MDCDDAAVLQHLVEDRSGNHGFDEDRSLLISTGKWPWFVVDPIGWTTGV